MEENSKNGKLLNYSFLINKPLGEDLFKNKSQEKIADVINEKIINKKDFKIIGIDGTWGSGKSNLIYLLQKKLKNSHTFFIYDVWGHQEDEQRKAILVELTEFIKSEPTLLKKNGKKNWDDELKTILASSKETTTINQPYLSVGFIFSLLSIVYIPSVNVFKDDLAKYFEIESIWVKVLLVMAPILIVIGIYIYNYFKNVVVGKKGLGKSFRVAAEETFQVYTNKQKEETKIETISENQPSVRDFQKWMQAIDDDLEKKVVIVFDNFDRLPKKHILNIWSSIHIFFAEKEYDNIKVILPFDREHVQNAFKDLNGNNDDQTFGDDYINKTFDIVFRITLPIMSDWKQFFESQWKSAFSSVDKDELHLVIQAYEFLSRRTTPREIIAFINEMLTIKLLNEKLRERYIAIFVLKKAEILEKPLEKILTLDYLGGLKSVYENDVDFGRQLTAIVYHVDIENAVEVIYSEELKVALNRYDVEKFNSICQSDFADSIFSGTISNIDVFENPIKTLAEIKTESKVQILHITQAWRTFYWKVLAGYVKTEKLEIADWQLILIQNSSHDQYLERILNDFVALVNDASILDYINLVDSMISTIGEERIVPALSSKYISAEAIVKLVEEKGNDYKKYKLDVFPELIDSYMSKLPIDNVLKLNNTKVLTTNFQLGKYQEQLEKEFTESVATNEVQKANDILKKVNERIIERNGELENLLTDEQIADLYEISNTEDIPIMDDAIAMRIVRGSSFNTRLAANFQDILEGEDATRAASVAKVILNYTTFGNLLVKAKDFKGLPLFKEVVMHLFEANIEKDFDPYQIIASYENIKESLGLEEPLLLFQLDIKVIDKSSLEIDDLSDAFICDSFHNPDSPSARAFIEKFNENFVNLDRDGVAAVFGNEANIHFRFFSYLNQNSITQSSLDVFEEMFLTKLVAGKADQDCWNILEKYEGNHSNISIENLLKNIRDKILNGQIDVNVAVALKILPYFIKYNILEASSDIFRTIIKNNFLNDKNFIDFLITNSDYVKSLYQNSSLTQKDGFRHTINEIRKTSDSVEGLAKQLGIKKSRD